MGKYDDIDRSVPENEDYYSDSYRYTKREDVNEEITRRFNSITDDEDAIDLNELINSYSNPSRRISNNNIERDPRRQQTEPPRQPRDPRQKDLLKKRKKHPGLLIVPILFLVLVVVFVGMFEGILSKVSYDEKLDNQYISSSDLISSDKVKNILLLGVDARSGEEDKASRADSMMLITIDSTNKTIKLTSFLRDSWVYIPCKDKYQRLNAACSYGGYQGVIDTIEYNFGIDIDGYIIADFEMFKVMVDSIGGVKVDVTEEEANEVTNHRGRYGNVDLDSGEYKLTGEQALAYCRIRKIDTDWKRTERQRTVITEIIKSTIKSGPVGAYKMASNVAPYIETNLTKSELKNIFISAVPCALGDFETQTCPADGTWEYARKGGASVIALNKDKNKEILQEFIFGDK